MATPIDRNKLIVAGLMILCSFFWGSAFVAIRVTLQELGGNPLHLLVVRFIPSGIFFLSYLFLTARKDIKRAVREDWVRLLGSALFGILIYHLAINLGETVVRADVAALIIALIPLLTIITSTIIYKYSQRLSMWLGAVIALAGVIIIIGFTPQGDRILINRAVSMSHGLGLLFVFVCPLTMIFYTFISKPLSVKYTPAISIGVGFVLAMIPMFFLIDSQLIGVLANATSRFWIPMIFLIVGSTIMGYMLWIISLRLATPSYVNLFLYLNPLWGVLTNRIVFPNEQFSVFIVLGGILIIGGVALGTGQLGRLFRLRTGGSIGEKFNITN